MVNNKSHEVISKTFIETLTTNGDVCLLNYVPDESVQFDSTFLCLDNILGNVIVKLSTDGHS